MWLGNKSYGNFLFIAETSTNTSLVIKANAYLEQLNINTSQANVTVSKTYDTTRLKQVPVVTGTLKQTYQILLSCIVRNIMQSIEIENNGPRIYERITL